MRALAWCLYCGHTCIKGTCLTHTHTHIHTQDVNKEDWDAVNAWMDAAVAGLDKLELQPVGEGGCLSRLFCFCVDPVTLSSCSQAGMVYSAGNRFAAPNNRDPWQVS